MLKLECVNHVAKRLGTGLRDLKAKLGAQGQSIGGRGKLTDDRIKQLTGYCGGLGWDGGSCVGKLFLCDQH